jgi:hypothetical protein
MSPFPSIGLAELAIIAAIVGLLLIVGVGTIAIVRTRSQRSSTGTQDLSGTEHGATKSRNRRKWLLVVLGLFLALALPLCAVAGGILLVTPVRQEMEPASHLVEVQPVTSQMPAIETGATPTATPVPLDTGREGAGALRDLGLGGISPLTALFLASILGVLLVGAGIVVVLPLHKRWRADEEASEASFDAEGGDIPDRMEKLRYVFLALALWIALGVFLFLDLAFSVSLYPRFIIVYAALWILVGALLLYGVSWREKLLILGLFVIALLTIRVVDWHSGKPFLRDLYSIEKGMDESQVDQIMDGYLKGYGGAPVGTPPQPEFGPDGELVTGWVIYRHTSEGWGDSDWGIVAFEGGQVVEVDFSPD